MKKIIKIVSNCFTCVLITLLLLLLFVNFCKRDEGYFRVGRYSLFDVNGNSMYPEIKNGDLIAVDMKDREKYEIGDIVSFISEKKFVITHEIETVIIENDSYKYVTKGINNEANDNGIVDHSEIIGEYKNFRIPLIGYVIGFSRTYVGYWLLVVTPLGLILLFTTYELLKEITKKKGEV